jgi:hypothetical protein
VQGGSTFDITKLTYSDGVSATYTLAGTYTKADTLVGAEAENYGKYFFDGENNKLIINLTQPDYQTLNSMPDFVMNATIAAQDTISAQAGWSINYQGTAASAVTAQTVTVQ